ncbi:MAG: cytochrome c oxidase subunit II [Hyphomicrobiaceae bacterium]
MAGMSIAAAPALAGMGQPSPWQLGLQEAGTDISDKIHAFHDGVNIVIIAIAIFVLILLAIVVTRFNEKANPTPSKTTHHTGLEVAWTIIPVFILVGIAIPSFKLLFAQYSYPKADVTLKATGNQWNWTYHYPDFNNFNFTSIMLTDAERQERAKKGIASPRLLSVDNEAIVPVGKVVHVLVTASDVIHNWTVPSFGSKVDAVPGRTTATWFRARKEGIYYGQCSELCGKDHAFMPIAVRVVKPEVFEQWAALMKDRKRGPARQLIEKIAIEQSQQKVAASGPVTVAGK